MDAVRRNVIIFVAVAMAFCASAVATAAQHPHAESDATIEGATIHQEITVWGRDTITYLIVVRNPAGVGPFCMTFQLERKSSSGWRRAGGKDGRDRACCPDPNPDEDCGSDPAHQGWPLSLYPRKSIRDDVASGRLRMRGFSDFGPSITLRLDGPLL